MELHITYYSDESSLRKITDINKSHLFSPSTHTHKQNNHCTAQAEQSIMHSSRRSYSYDNNNTYIMFKHMSHCASDMCVLNILNMICSMLCLPNVSTMIVCKQNKLFIRMCFDVLVWAAIRRGPPVDVPAACMYYVFDVDLLQINNNRKNKTLCVMPHPMRDAYQTRALSFVNLMCKQTDIHKSMDSLILLQYGIFFFFSPFIDICVGAGAPKTLLLSDISMCQSEQKEETIHDHKAIFQLWFYYTRTWFDWKRCRHVISGKISTTSTSNA